MEVFSVSTLACMIYLLIVHCFAPRSKIFSTYGTVTFANEGLQNLGLYSAFMALQQELRVPHPMRHGTSVFVVSSEGPSRFRPLLIKLGVFSTLYVIQQAVRLITTNLNDKALTL